MRSDSEGHDSVPNNTIEQGSQGAAATGVQEASRWNENLRRFSQQQRLLAELAVELRRSVDGVEVHEVCFQFPPTMDVADMVPATAAWVSAACTGPGEGAFLVITGTERSGVMFKGVVKSAKRRSMLRRYWGRFTAVAPAPVKTTMIEREDIRDRLPCVILSALGEPAPNGMGTADRIFAAGNLLDAHRRFTGSEAMHPGLDLGAFLAKATGPEAPLPATASSNAVLTTAETETKAGSAEATPRPTPSCIDCGNPIVNRGRAAKRCIACATALEEKKKAKSSRTTPAGAASKDPETGKAAR